MATAGARRGGMNAAVDKAAVDLLAPALAARVRRVGVADELWAVEGLQLLAVVQLQEEDKAGRLVDMATVTNELSSQERVDALFSATLGTSKGQIEFNDWKLTGRTWGTGVVEVGGLGGTPILRWVNAQEFSNAHPVCLWEGILRMRRREKKEGDQQAHDGRVDLRVEVVIKIQRPAVSFHILERPCVLRWALPSGLLAGDADHVLDGVANLH